MRIHVTVNLEKGEDLAYAPDAAAMQVLTALGANATEDYCQVYVYASTEPGEAGVPPPPAEPT
jgi:hypothetical protein